MWARNMQAYLDAAKAILLSSLECKRDSYHAPATPSMPKLSSAELQLERQIENLGRCNRPAEAAALQKEVIRNRRAAAERLEQARVKNFERKVRLWHSVCMRHMHALHNMSYLDTARTCPVGRLLATHAVWILNKQGCCCRKAK